jgi:hypothetical protein
MPYSEDIAIVSTRTMGVQTVRRLTVAAFLCACALVVASCGSSDATTTRSVETTGAFGLYPVSVDGKWGFIDKTGTIKIEPVDYAFDFSEGLAMAKATENDVEKWGYIDTSGTVVIPPQFLYAAPFSDGLAAVGDLSGDEVLGGFIDKTGALVIPMQYAYPSQLAFSEGLCRVMVEEGGNQTWGFIDKTGAMVIEPQFYDVRDFSEGLAAVSGFSNEDPHGFIDKNGDWVIELPPDLMLGGFGQGFSEGLALVEGMVFDAAQGSGLRRGYIDTSGAVVIGLQFDIAFGFSEGLAAVGVTENGVTKWGYVDKTGAWVVQPQYDEAGSFSEGLASVGLLLATGDLSDDVSISDFRYGYIDKTGAVVIPIQYESALAHAFSGGVARVET